MQKYRQQDMYLFRTLGTLFRPLMIFLLLVYCPLADSNVVGVQDHGTQHANHQVYNARASAYATHSNNYANHPNHPPSKKKHGDVVFAVLEPNIPRQNEYSLRMELVSGSGFFSCCSVKLDEIVKVYNNHHVVPSYINGSHWLVWYKPENASHTYDDVTHVYFKDLQQIDNQRIGLDVLLQKGSSPERIDYKHQYQFSDYAKDLNFKLLSPLIKKFFSPSDEIMEIVNTMENKYNISNYKYDDIGVVFFRGNDKVKEQHSMASYSDIQQRTEHMIRQHKNDTGRDMKLIIQSDETDFINKMVGHFPNHIIFKDEIRHMKTNPKLSVDHMYSKDANHQFSKFYLAITIIMSKANKIVFASSGNCSIWVLLFRGHANNIVQYLGKYNKFWLSNM